MEKLTLTKNAELIETYWHYDNATNSGDYLTRTIDHLSPHYLHDQYCYLEEDVTLENIFQFLIKNIDLLDLYLGNWCEDLAQESLLESNEENSDSEYLELYWIMDKNESVINFPYRMDLHGVGKEDKFSLMFCSVNNIKNLIVKINPKLVLYKDYDSSEYLGDMFPTLFQILYGIVWELSFLGNPAKRDSEKEKIEGIRENITREIDWEHVCQNKEKEL